MDEQYVFDVVPAFDLRDLGSFMHRDIRCPANATDEVFRHPRAERAARHEVNAPAAAALGQVHRRLTGRIPAADHMFET